MPSTRAFLFISLSLLLSYANAQPSLCADGETTEWSCAAKGKVYSLCASADLSSTAGHMRYLAGRISKTEFAFPERPEHPKGHFLLRLEPRGASLSFTNGGYAYVIYEPLAGSTTIEVSKGSISVGSITCSSATDTLTLTETQNRFKSLGIYQ